MATLYFIQFSNVLHGEIPDDSIALCSYFVDIHKRMLISA